MVANICIPSNQEVEGGWLPPECQSGLHSKTQMFKHKNKKLTSLSSETQGASREEGVEGTKEFSDREKDYERSSSEPNVDSAIMNPQ